LRGRPAATRATKRLPVCTVACDADVARALFAARPRLLDAADVAEAGRRTASAEGRDDRTTVQALRRVGGPGLLAVPHPQLGRRGIAGLDAFCGVSTPAAVTRARWRVADLLRPGSSVEGGTH